MIAQRLSPRAICVNTRIRLFDPDLMVKQAEGLFAEAQQEKGRLVEELEGCRRELEVKRAVHVPRLSGGNGFCESLALITVFLLQMLCRAMNITTIRDLLHPKRSCSTRQIGIFFCEIETHVETHRCLCWQTQMCILAHVYPWTRPPNYRYSFSLFDSSLLTSWTPPRPARLPHLVALDKWMVRSVGRASCIVRRT